MLGEPRAKRVTESIDPIERDIVQDTLGESQEECHLLANGHWRELALSKHCADALTVHNRLARALVYHRAEAGKQLEFQELCVF